MLTSMRHRGDTCCTCCHMQVDDTDVINFLLSTEIIPLCLRTMEIGSELSKTVATFIVQKILLDDVSENALCCIGMFIDLLAGWLLMHYGLATCCRLASTTSAQQQSAFLQWAQCWATWWSARRSRQSSLRSGCSNTSSDVTCGFRTTPG